VLTAIAVTFSLESCTIYGDEEPPPGFSIENRTDSALTIYAIGFEGKKVLAGEVPPHESRRSTFQCIGSEQFIAETADGTVVARRGPFEQCNRDRWVIRES
jgi:hypothetical protein